jgi:hypothetical protein
MGEERTAVNLFRPAIAFMLFLLFFGEPDGIKATQSSQKDGSLVVNVAWGDMNSTPANDVYVEAYTYLNKSNAYKSFVLKMSRNGQYEASLPPGIYDVFVSEHFNAQMQASADQARSAELLDTKAGSRRCVYG